MLGRCTNWLGVYGSHFPVCTVCCGGVLCVRAVNCVLGWHTVC